MLLAARDRRADVVVPRPPGTRLYALGGLPGDEGQVLADRIDWLLVEGEAWGGAEDRVGCEESGVDVDC